MHLFSPLQLRGVTLPNRIMVSPMAQYSAEAGEVTINYLRDRQSATTKATMAPRESRRVVRPVRSEK